MTFREALAGGDLELRRRLDALLESDDAVVVMADRHGVASYAHGFGISGCQLEFMIREVEAAIRFARGEGGDDLPEDGG